MVAFALILVQTETYQSNRTFIFTWIKVGLTLGLAILFILLFCPSFFFFFGINFAHFVVGCLTVEITFVLIHPILFNFGCYYAVFFFIFLSQTYNNNQGRLLFCCLETEEPRTPWLNKRRKKNHWLSWF